MMEDRDLKKCDSVEKLLKLNVPLESALVINGVSKEVWRKYKSKNLINNIPDPLREMFK